MCHYCHVIDRLRNRKNPLLEVILSAVESHFFFFVAITKFFHYAKCIYIDLVLGFFTSSVDPTFGWSNSRWAWIIRSFESYKSWVIRVELHSWVHLLTAQNKPPSTSKNYIGYFKSYPKWSWSHSKIDWLIKNNNRNWRFSKNENWFFKALC